MKRALLGCLGGLALLAGASGCNTYKYFEIHASFDPTTLQSDQTGNIRDCVITVSGAESARFTLHRNVCPPPVTSTAPLDIGTFEYSSFADSGTLTFTFDGFAGVAQMPRCTVAHGTKMVAVTADTTINDTLVAAAAPTPPAADCFGVTMPGTGM
jgi:hypothetical protein